MPLGARGGGQRAPSNLIWLLVLWLAVAASSARPEPSSGSPMRGHNCTGSGCGGRYGVCRAPPAPCASTWRGRLGCFVRGLRPSGGRAAVAAADEPSWWLTVALPFAFVALHVAAVVVEIMIAMGLIVPSGRVLAIGWWCVLPITVGYYHMGHWALGGLIGDDRTAPPERMITHAVLCATLFSALSIQGLLFVIVNQIGPRRHLGYLMLSPLSVYLAGASYYAYEYIGQQIVVCDVFGHELHPERFVLWLCSVSNQCVLFAQLGSHELNAPLQPAIDGASLATSLLLAQVLFGTGLLGSLELGLGTGVCVLFNAASVGSFYVLLYQSTRPLIRCERVFTRRAQGAINGQARALQAVVRQFYAVRMYVVVSWHTFPIIWAAAILGLITSDQREFAYALGDLFAKLLPVSIYLGILGV